MSGGPFRADPRVLRRVRCGSLDDLRNAWGTRHRNLVYSALVSIPAVTLAQLSVTGAWSAPASAALQLALVLVIVRSQRSQSAATAESQALVLPTECVLGPDWLVLVGPTGTTHWRYASIVGIAAAGARVFVELPSGLAVLIPEDGDAPALARFVRTLAPHASSTIDGRGARLRRHFGYAALAHAVVVAGALLVLSAR